MGVLSWIVLGFVAGAIAKALHRGDEPSGLLATLFVDVLGALLGGFIASAVGIGSISGFFSLGTWLIAIVGALVLLVLYDAITSRSGARAPRSRAAAAVAADLAAMLDRPLLLPNAPPVTPPLMSLASVRHAPMDYSERADAARERARSLLADLARPVRARSVECTLGSGLPAHSVLETAARTDASLVVTGTHIIAASSRRPSSEACRAAWSPEPTARSSRAGRMSRASWSRWPASDGRRSSGSGRRRSAALGRRCSDPSHERRSSTPPCRWWS
jgi:uncharacterized membrane protein YeaQ/YmgE (transglycosylase-associated protein family)